MVEAIKSALELLSSLLDPAVQTLTVRPYNRAR